MDTPGIDGVPRAPAAGKSDDVGSGILAPNSLHRYHIRTTVRTLARTNIVMFETQDITKTSRDGLNERQLEAVTHSDGPLLIVAGAGTGKTRTLANRVAHLVSKATSPERVMLLTFTRRLFVSLVARELIAWKHLRRNRQKSLCDPKCVDICEMFGNCVTVVDL